MMNNSMYQNNLIYIAFICITFFFQMYGHRLFLRKHIISWRALLNWNCWNISNYFNILRQNLFQIETYIERLQAITEMETLYKHELYYEFPSKDKISHNGNRKIFYGTNRFSERLYITLNYFRIGNVQKYHIESEK